MTSRLNSGMLRARGEIVSPPIAPIQRACTDQTFELPGAIYVAMALMFVGFVAILGFSLSEHMAVSLGVIFFYLAAFFTVPAILSRTNLEGSSTRSLSIFEFADKGIATATGRVRGGDATILVLLLPFVILTWGVAIAIVAALV